MNIDEMRNVVISGQIATVTAQIETWNIYSARTGEDVTEILATLAAHVAALIKLLK